MPGNKKEIRIGDTIITQERIHLMASFYLRKDNKVHYRDYFTGKWVSEDEDHFDYERTDPIEVTEKQLKELQAILPDGPPAPRPKSRRAR